MPIILYELPYGNISCLPKLRLYLWANDNDIPVKDFLFGLNKSRSESFTRLNTLFNRIMEHGKIYNPEQFKDIKGHKPLFEFKAHGVRIYCVFDSNKLILLEGDIKKTDKSSSANMNAIKRAEERWELYKESKDKGRLEVRK